MAYNKKAIVEFINDTIVMNEGLSPTMVKDIERIVKTQVEMGDADEYIKKLSKDNNEIRQLLEEVLANQDNNTETTINVSNNSSISVDAPVQKPVPTPSVDVTVESTPIQLPKTNSKDETKFRDVIKEQVRDNKNLMTFSAGMMKQAVTEGYNVFGSQINTVLGEEKTNLIDPALDIYSKASGMYGRFQDFKGSNDDSAGDIAESINKGFTDNAKKAVGSPSQGDSVPLVNDVVDHLKENVAVSKGIQGTLVGQDYQLDLLQDIDKVLADSARTLQGTLASNDSQATKLAMIDATMKESATILNGTLESNNGQKSALTTMSETMLSTKETLAGILANVDGSIDEILQLQSDAIALAEKEALRLQREGEDKEDSGFIERMIKRLMIVGALGLALGAIVGSFLYPFEMIGKGLKILSTRIFGVSTETTKLGRMMTRVGGFFGKFASVKAISESLTNTAQFFRNFKAQLKSLNIFGTIGKYLKLFTNIPGNLLKIVQQTYGLMDAGEKFGGMIKMFEKIPLLGKGVTKIVGVVKNIKDGATALYNGTSLVSKVFRGVGKGMIGVLKLLGKVRFIFSSFAFFSKAFSVGMGIFGKPLFWLLGIIDFIKGFMKSTEESFMGKVADGLKQVVYGFIEMPAKLFGWVVEKVMGWFGVEVSGVGDKIIGFVMGATDMLLKPFAYIYAAFKVFKNFGPLAIILGVINFIKGIFYSKDKSISGRIVSGMRDMVSGFLEIPIKAVGWLIDAVAGWFGIEMKGTAGLIFKGFTDFLDWIATPLVDWLNVIGATIGSMFKKLWSGVKHVFGFIANIVGFVWNLFTWDTAGMKKSGKGIGKAILGVIGSLAGMLWDFMMLPKKLVVSFLKTIWKGMKKVGPQILDMLWGIPDFVLDMLGRVAKGFIGIIKKAVKGFFNLPVTLFGLLVEKVMGLFGADSEGMGLAIKDKFNSVVDGIFDPFISVFEWVKNLISGMVSWVRDHLTVISKGLRKGFGNDGVKSTSFRQGGMSRRPPAKKTPPSFQVGDDLQLEDGFIKEKKPEKKPEKKTGLSGWWARMNAPAEKPTPSPIKDTFGAVTDKVKETASKIPKVDVKSNIDKLINPEMVRDKAIMKMEEVEKRINSLATKMINTDLKNRVMVGSRDKYIAAVVEQMDSRDQLLLEQGIKLRGDREKDIKAESSIKDLIGKISTVDVKGAITKIVDKIPKVDVDAIKNKMPKLDIKGAVAKIADKIPTLTPSILSFKDELDKRVNEKVNQMFATNPNLSPVGLYQQISGRIRQDMMSEGYGTPKVDIKGAIAKIADKITTLTPDENKAIARMKELEASIYRLAKAQQKNMMSEYGNEHGTNLTLEDFADRIKANIGQKSRDQLERGKELLKGRSGGIIDKIPNFDIKGAIAKITDKIPKIDTKGIDPELIAKTLDNALNEGYGGGRRRYSKGPLEKLVNKAQGVDTSAIIGDIKDKVATAKDAVVEKAQTLAQLPIVKTIGNEAMYVAEQAKAHLTKRQMDAASATTKAVDRMNKDTKDKPERPIVVNTGGGGQKQNEPPEDIESMSILFLNKSWGLG